MDLISNKHLHSYNTSLEIRISLNNAANRQWDQQRTAFQDVNYLNSLNRGIKQSTSLAIFEHNISKLKKVFQKFFKSNISKVFDSENDYR